MAHSQNENKLYFTVKKKKGEKKIYILRILTGLPKGESLYCASVLAVGGGDSKTTLVISKI